MDILFSGFLILFCVYCYILVGAESPAPTATELGAAFWPRIILILLLVLLAVNVVHSVKKKRAGGGSLTESFDIQDFFRGKLLKGMLLVAVMAGLMPYIGFIPVSFLFLISYGILLGEKKIGRLALFSLLITAILYALFQGALDIMLARGTGIFRNFALFFETHLPF